MEILTKKDDSEAVEGSSHFLVMLTMGMKEAAMEYVKSGQPNGPFPDSGDGKRDVLLRFGYALRCLWDDLRKDVNGSIVEKKARTAGSVESQTEALMNLKTNLALCQDCLDEDLPGSSDLYARFSFFSFFLFFFFFLFLFVSFCMSFTPPPWVSHTSPKPGILQMPFVTWQFQKKDGS